LPKLVPENSKSPRPGSEGNKLQPGRSKASPSDGSLLLPL